MNHKDIEKYWYETSEEDFDVATVLFDKEKYTHAMFFLHIAVEKMLKALYVNRNKKDAPYSHNLQNLATKITNIEFNEEIITLLTELTTFNISTRYNDYKRSFEKVCDKKFAEKYFEKAKDLLKWLKSLI